MNEDQIKELYNQLTGAGYELDDDKTFSEDFKNDESFRKQIHGYMTEDKLTDKDYNSWNSQYAVQQPTRNAQQKQTVNNNVQAPAPVKEHVKGLAGIVSSKYDANMNYVDADGKEYKGSDLISGIESNISNIYNQGYKMLAQGRSLDEVANDIASATGLDKQSIVDAYTNSGDVDNATNEYNAYVQKMKEQYADNQQAEMSKLWEKALAEWDDSLNAQKERMDKFNASAESLPYKRQLIDERKQTLYEADKNNVETNKYWLPVYTANGHEYGIDIDTKQFTTPILETINKEIDNDITNEIKSDISYKFSPNKEGYLEVQKDKYRDYNIEDIKSRVLEYFDKYQKKTVQEKAIKAAMDIQANNEQGVAVDVNQVAKDAVNAARTDLIARTELMIEKRLTPKTKTDAVIGFALENSIPGKVLRGLTWSGGTNELYEYMANRYRQENYNGWDTAIEGTVSFAADMPFFGVSGSFSAKTVSKMFSEGVEHLVMQGVSKANARALISAYLGASVGRNIMARKALQGAIGSGLNMFYYDMMSGAAEQFAQKRFAPGENIKDSFLGAITMAPIGVMGEFTKPLIGSLSGLTKGVARVGEFGLETSLFAGGGWFTKWILGAYDQPQYLPDGSANPNYTEFKPWEDWVEAAKSLAGMKVASLLHGKQAFKEMFSLKESETNPLGFNKAEHSELTDTPEGKALLKIINGGEQTGLDEAFINFVNCPTISYVTKQKISKLLTGSVIDQMPIPTHTTYDGKVVTIYGSDMRPYAKEVLDSEKDAKERSEELNKTYASDRAKLRLGKLMENPDAPFTTTDENGEQKPLQVRNPITGEMEDANLTNGDVARMHEDGTFHLATVKGADGKDQKVFITNGEIATDDNGSIDRVNSSESIVYIGSDGQPKVTTPDKISETQNVSLEEYVYSQQEERRQPIDSLMQAKGRAVKEDQAKVKQALNQQNQKALNEQVAGYDKEAWHPTTPKKAKGKPEVYKDETVEPWETSADGSRLQYRYSQRNEDGAVSHVYTDGVGRAYSKQAGLADKAGSRATHETYKGTSYTDDDGEKMEYQGTFVDSEGREYVKYGSKDNYINLYLDDANDKGFLDSKLNKGEEVKTEPEAVAGNTVEGEAPVPTPDFERGAVLRDNEGNLYRIEERLDDGSYDTVRVDKDGRVIADTEEVLDGKAFTERGIVDAKAEPVKKAAPEPVAETTAPVAAEETATTPVEEAKPEPIKTPQQQQYEAVSKMLRGDKKKVGEKVDKAIADTEKEIAELEKKIDEVDIDMRHPEKSQAQIDKLAAKRDALYQELEGWNAVKAEHNRTEEVKPVAETPVEEAKPEPIKTEAPKEEPKVETTEEPKVEEPKVEETPAPAEEPTPVEEPKAETPEVKPTAKKVKVDRPMTIEEIEMSTGLTERQKANAIAQRKRAQFVIDLAHKYNIPVVSVDGYFTNRAEGAFNGSQRVIYINADMTPEQFRMQVSNIIGHEMKHSLDVADNKVLYNNLVDYAKKTKEFENFIAKELEIGKVKGFTSLEEAIKAKKAQYKGDFKVGKEDEMALDEIMSDFFGSKILGNEDYVRRMMESQPKTVKTVRIIYDYVRDMLNTLRGKENEPHYVELQKMADMLEHALEVNTEVDKIKRSGGKDIEYNEKGEVEKFTDKDGKVMMTKERMMREAKDGTSNTIGESMEGTDGKNEPVRKSVTAHIEGAGLRTNIDENGKVSFVHPDGRVFDAEHPLTVDDVRNIPNTSMFFMMNDARDLGIISAEKEGKFWQKYTDLLNHYLEKGGGKDGSFENLTSNYQWIAETVYKAVAINSDSQYNFSLDITRVCKKNEAVINAISEMQRQVGYGITPGQIMELYMKTDEAGYQVPCPVCYVFSRYIRNGKYATIMINGQRKYGSQLVDPKTLSEEEKQAKINYWLEEKAKAEKFNTDNEAAIAQANEDITELLDQIDALSKKITNKNNKYTQEERDAMTEQVRALDARYRAALNLVSQSSLDSWITQFAIHEVGEKANKHWELWEDSYKPFPEEMALDLRQTATVMREYPAVQRFRKSRGAAAGKEIHFVSNNDIGDVAMALGSKGATEDLAKPREMSDEEWEALKQEENGILKGGEQNLYLRATKETDPEKREELLKAARNRLRGAHIYAQQQSLRGGQRMWSWSDNIERLAPDVFVNLMQLEMLDGALQSYSKQLEGIAHVASLNGYVNGSLMGKGNGYREISADAIEMVNGKPYLKDGDFRVMDENGEITDTLKTPVWVEGEGENAKYYVLEFDDTVGIDAFGKADPEDGHHLRGLFELNKQYDRAGNIMVGMNDRHVRMCMADDRIFFIIPWHASGANNHILAQMYQYLGVPYNRAESTDYTNVQEEKRFDGKESKVSKQVMDFWEDYYNNARTYAGQQIKGSDFKSSFDIKSGDGKGGLSEGQEHYNELRNTIFQGVRIPEFTKKGVMRMTGGKPKMKTASIASAIDELSRVDHPEAKKALKEIKTAYAEIMGDEFLSQVYNKVNGLVNVNGKMMKRAGWDVDLMTSEDCKHIYPYEYWNEDSTYETADVNTPRYLEYCRRLGFKPKFCGKLPEVKLDKKGNPIDPNDFGNFVDDHGYWKLLIDRRMYDVKGKFQDLTPVDVEGFTPDLIDPDKTKQRYPVTEVASDAATADIVKGALTLESTRPGGQLTVDYYNAETNADPTKAVKDYTQARDAYAQASEKAPADGLLFSKSNNQDTEFDKMPKPDPKGKTPAQYAKELAEWRHNVNQADEVRRQGEDIRFSKRVKADPTETIDCYKLMRLGEDGEVYPLYIDRDAEPILRNTWYDGDVPNIEALKAYKLEDESRHTLDNGQPYTNGMALLLDKEGNVLDSKPIVRTYGYKDDEGKNKSGLIKGIPSKEMVEGLEVGQRWMTVTIDANGEYSYHNVGINGAEGTSTYALRPGWHAAMLPSMEQIGKGKNKNLRDDNFVWVRGKLAAEHKFVKGDEGMTSAGDMPLKMPEDGYYEFMTNPKQGAEKKAKAKAEAEGREYHGNNWYVSGAFMPEEIISDAEARRVIDEHNKKYGTQVPYDYERESGKVFDGKQLVDKDPTDPTTPDGGGGGSRPDVLYSKSSRGIAWQGSKAQQADEIMNVLPKGKRFVDLFSGGGAMTDAALDSGKYKSFHMNDLLGLGQRAFLNAVEGKYHDYNRFISTPEEFESIRDTAEAPLHSYNGYGRNVANIDKNGRDKQDEQIRRARKLERFQPMRDKIGSSELDYREVEIKPGDVLYADIPYYKEEKSGYRQAGKFDYKAFSEWASKLDQPVYVSEYTAPEGFTEIWRASKPSPNGKIEKLFVQNKFADEVKASMPKNDNIRLSKSQDTRTISERSKDWVKFRRENNIPENGKVDINKVGELFNRYNVDETLGALFNRVSDTIKNRGIEFSFTDDIADGIAGQSGKLAGVPVVQYKKDSFSFDGRSDQTKAKILLHEMIHQVATGLQNRYNRHGADGLTDVEKACCAEFEKIYQAVKQLGGDFYGLKNSTEMVAELANPKFREWLSQQEYSTETEVKPRNLLQWCLDNLRNMFGDTTKATPEGGRRNALEGLTETFDNLMTEEIGNEITVDNTLYDGEEVRYSKGNEYSYTGSEDLSGEGWFSSFARGDYSLDYLQGKVNEYRNRLADEIERGRDESWLRSLREHLSKLENALEARKKWDVQKETIKTNLDNFGLKLGEPVGIEKAKDVFDSVNTNKDMKKLFDKVYKQAKKLGVKFRVEDTYYAGNYSGLYRYEQNDIAINDMFFTDDFLSMDRPAEIILHEMIHGVTSRALLIGRYANSGSYYEQALRKKYAPLLTPEINELWQEIHSLYVQSKKRNPYAYGSKNEQEFIAELANPTFRRKIQADTIWKKVVNAIAKFFGKTTKNAEETNTLDELTTLLDKALTSWSRKQGNAFEKVYNGESFDALEQGGDMRFSKSQTKSESFKNWFGDWEKDPKHASKVVNENGEPLVVYHGSPKAGFYEFNDNNGAIWGSTKKEHANVFTRGGRGNGEGYEDGIYPLYMNIKKPLNVGYVDTVMSDSDDFYDICDKLGMDAYELVEKCLPEEWKQELRRSEEEEYYGEDAKEHALFGIPYYMLTRSKNFAEIAKSKGYDGLIAEETINDGSYKNAKTYAVFDSSQIKSATANNGEFDPSNPDIRFSRSNNYSDLIGEAASNHDMARVTRLAKSVLKQSEKYKKDSEEYKAMVKAVSDYFTSAINLEWMDAIGKQKLSRMLRLFPHQSGATQEKMLTQAEGLVRDLEVRHLENSVTRLLQLKVQGKNGTGIPVGKTVDDDTRQVFGIIRELNGTANATEFDDEVHDLGSQLWHARRDAKTAEADYRSAVDELGYNAPETRKLENEWLEAQSKIEDLKNQYNELRGKQTAVRGDVKAQRPADLDDEIATLLNKEGDLDENEERRLTALQILRPLAEAEAYDGKGTDENLGLMGIEEQTSKLSAKIRELNKEFTGASEQRKAEIREEKKLLKSKIDGLEVAANQVKSRQAQAYREAETQLKSIIEGGRESLKKQVQAEKDRGKEIIQKSIHDLHPVESFDRREKNHGVPMSPKELNEKKHPHLSYLVTGILKSFDYMCSKVSRNLSQEGFLYDHFMYGDDGAMAAEENYIARKRKATQTFDDVCQKIFGMNFDKAGEEFNRMDKNTVRLEYTIERPDPENEGQTIEVKDYINLTQANLMYLYQVNKQDDGKMKLCAMGFTEETLAKAFEELDPKCRQFADWMQNEWYPKMREEMNELHKEIFFTSMAKIDNYCPIKISKNKIVGKNDSVNGMPQTDQASTKNGSLINRTVNCKPIELATSAFEVLRDHTIENIEWLSYTRFRKDMDYVLNSPTFRARMNANNQGSYEDFKTSANIAMRRYLPAGGNADTAVAKIMAGGTATAIGFHNWTAIKQLLSYPCFYAYSQHPAYLASITKNAFTPASNLKWVRENSPLLLDRLESGLAGATDLERELMRLGDGAYGKFIEQVSKFGMAANKFVDYLTCAAGARAIYDYELPRLKEMYMQGGDSEEVASQKAHTMALRKAEIAFNQTQQSSLPAFKAQTQVDRGIGDRYVSLFKTSPAGQSRKSVLGALDIMKGASDYEGLVKRRMEMTGEDEATARKRTNNSMRKAAMQFAINGWLAKEIWDKSAGVPGMVTNAILKMVGLGGLGWIGSQALDNDPDDKDGEKAWETIVRWLSYPIQGTVLGDFLHDGIAGSFGYNPFSIMQRSMYTDTFELIKKVAEKDDTANWGKLIGTATKMGVVLGMHLDPEVLANVVIVANNVMSNGIEEDLAINVALLLMMPKEARRDAAQIYHWNGSPMEYAKAMAMAHREMQDIPMNSEWLKDKSALINATTRALANLKKQDQKSIKAHLKEWEEIQCSDEENDNYEKVEKNLKSYNKAMKETNTKPMESAQTLSEIDGHNPKWNAIASLSRQMKWTREAIDVELNKKDTNTDEVNNLMRKIVNMKREILDIDNGGKYDISEISKREGQASQQREMRNNKISFEDLKQDYVNHGYTDANSWKNFDDYFKWKETHNGQ